MTDGFGVDLTEIGALAGGVRAAADSLGQAGQALGGAIGSDLGHPGLNAAVEGLVIQAHSLLTGLGTHTGGMADDLHATGQSYAESDLAGQSGIAAAQQAFVGQQAVNSLLSPDTGGEDQDPVFYDPAGKTPTLG